MAKANLVLLFVGVLLLVAVYLPWMIRHQSATADQNMIAIAGWAMGLAGYLGLLLTDPAAKHADE